MKKIIIFILFVTSELFGTDFDILKQVANENSKIKTIEADILQHIKKTGSSSENFKGRYRANSKGFFRIDYVYPEKQQVLYLGSKLFWFFPDNNLLYVSKKFDGFVNPKVNPLKEISDIDDVEVKYLGYTLYSIFKFVRKYEIKKDNLIITLFVDIEKPYVYKKVVSLGGNYEIVEEKYENYKSINGVYFPQIVDVRVRNENGYTRSRTEYLNVRINLKFNNYLFKQNFPNGVERRFLNLK